MFVLYIAKYGAPHFSKTDQALQNVVCHSYRKPLTAKLLRNKLEHIANQNDISVMKKKILKRCAISK